MTFKQKNLLGFGSILVIIIILMIIIDGRLNSSRSDLLEIVDDRYQKVSYINDIQREFSESERTLTLLGQDANAPSKEEISTATKTIEQNHITIEDRFRKLEEIANTEKGASLLAEFSASYENYTKLETQLITDMQKGMTSYEALRAEKDKASNSVLIVIANFVDFQEGLMDGALERADEKYNQMQTIILSALIVTIVLTLLLAYWIISSSSRELNRISEVITKVDLSDTTTMPRIDVKVEDEIGQIAAAFNRMSASLEVYSKNEKEYTQQIKNQGWVQTQVAEVAEMYQGIFKIDQLAEEFINKISPIMEAELGAFYLRDDNNHQHFYKIASHGNGGRDEFNSGEGVIGQAVSDQKVVILEDIPGDYKPIITGLGEINPKSIVIAPVLYEHKVIAVLEFASIKGFTDIELQTIKHMLDNLGMAIHSVLGRMEVERLLNESQAMTEELQVQAEELQTQSEELQMQSEELRMINEQLEERNQEAEQKSRELEISKEELEVKNEQLLQSSKYKSEFLANMSHELRTPLNSILILSEMLAEKEPGEYTEEEKEFAKVIHTSGNDLMALINDILDLSKIEAGKLEVFFNETNVCEIIETLERVFTPQAEQKGLDLTIEKEDDLPSIFYTDEQRMQQILKNLLSNAVKFTEKGTVTMKLEKVRNTREKEMLDRMTETDFWMKIIVTDTGPGIAFDKQQIIFEAFQQADGATARKYGGTGLGLSISREFTKLLGGHITLDSAEGEGSTFTVYLPNLPEGIMKKKVSENDDLLHLPISNEVMEQIAVQKEIVDVEEPVENHVLDVFNGKKVLITDDDHRNIFALKSALESKGVQTIVAKNGIECLEIIKEHTDLDMILMDIMMPELDGYDTMRHIRVNPDFTSIPIIALTAKAMKGDREKCIEAGATDYISKPINLEQLFSVMSVWLTK